MERKQVERPAPVAATSVTTSASRRGHQPDAPLPASALMDASSSAPPPDSAQPRVKSTTRHWRALRNALLSKPTHANDNDSATASAISTGFFPVCSVRKAAVRTADSTSTNTAAGEHEPDISNPRQLICRQPEPNFEWLEYDVTLCRRSTTTHDTEATETDPPTTTNVRVVVHEKRKDTRVTISELLSHKVNAGVDNTGNVRTWPSEALLLSFLLRTNVCEQLYAHRRLACSRDDSQAAAPRLNCCELGSGMAGLASLGLLAHARVPLGRVDITDGNPLSVHNLTLCVAENTALGVFARARGADVHTKLLRWDRSAQFDAIDRHQFDLLLASDCLFFEDFHADLAHTIRELLRPVSGRCYLLQPSRGGSMERFIDVAQQRYGLIVDRLDAFDDAVVQLDAEYVQTRSDYIPDVHLPVLLVVTSPVLVSTPSESWEE